jgi:hypothetical protein
MGHVCTSVLRLIYVFTEDGDDEPQQFVQAVVVRMYLVQPKSLQECHIAFLPPGALGDMKLSTLSHDSLSKSPVGSINYLNVPN